MRKFALTILAAMGFLLCSTANSHAGVRVGVYFGGPGPAYCPPPVYYGGYYHPYYHHRYYHRYYGRRW